MTNPGLSSRIFKTSLDNLAKGVTLGITILFAGLIIGQFFIGYQEGGVVAVFIPVLLLLIYFTAYWFRPVNYEVTPENLIIHRAFSSVKIDKDLIKSVELLDKKDLRWSFRTFGVGGLFGYYGKFANTTLGSMTWYATRRDRSVLVKTVQDKRIILTPDEPEKFVANFS